MDVFSVENNLLKACRYRITTGNQMSFYCNENHFVIFEHFGMYDILGDITKPLSESNDTMEKEDKAPPDDITEGNDSSLGEEQGGNSMTEEVK